MGPWIYGVKKATIGIDEIMVKCPSCEVDNYADIMVMSNYYHIWFIPIFPIGKEINIVCQKCGLRRYNVPFNSRTVKNYEEIKHEFRHPWYTYFTVIIASLIVFIVIFLKF